MFNLRVMESRQIAIFWGWGVVVFVGTQLPRALNLGIFMEVRKSEIIDESISKKSVKA